MIKSLKWYIWLAIIIISLELNLVILNVVMPKIEKGGNMMKYEKIVKEIAKEYGLDWILVYAILIRESSENEHAIRFEDRFYKKYMDKLRIPTTEKMLRSFSYGLMQIMGNTAREFGFGDEFDELFKPEVNIRIGCKILKHLFDILKEQKYVISAYNCGIGIVRRCMKENLNVPNASYVEKVIAEYDRIKNEIG